MPELNIDTVRQIEGDEAVGRMITHENVPT
jgi:hypothetical protein